MSYNSFWKGKHFTVDGGVVLWILTWYKVYVLDVVARYDAKELDY